MHDTAYVAITYWKRVRNYLAASEGRMQVVYICTRLNINSILKVSKERRLLANGN
jgi:hypothetical protein